MIRYCHLIRLYVPVFETQLTLLNECFLFKISSIVPKIPKLTLEERLMLEPPPPKEEKSRTIDGLDLHQAPLPPIPSQAEEPEGIPPSPQYNKLFDTESTKSESPEITINVPTTPDLRKMGSQVEEPSTSVPPSAVYSRMQSPPKQSSTVPPSAVYSRMQSPPEESSTFPPSAVYSRMQSPPEGTTSGVPESAVYSRMMSNEEQPAESDVKKDEKGAAFFMTQVSIHQKYYEQWLLFWQLPMESKKVFLSI